MERCTSHITNTYHVPNVRVSGYLCATNLPSNTAFRGFGAPQAMFFMESVINRISKELRMDPNAVRANNFLANGQTTIYNQSISDFTVGDCWYEVLARSAYTAKRDEIARFNGYVSPPRIHIIHIYIYI